MLQVEKDLVDVDFTEESEKSLKYVLALAKEINVQFVVLQVIERNVEKYSLVFPVVLLEKWPFATRSIQTIPVGDLPSGKASDLADVIQRIVKRKAQSRRRNGSIFDIPVKLLAVTFHEDKIDMVIFELGRRLPFAHRVAVELLMLIRKFPYPVLLTEPGAKQSGEADGPVRVPTYNVHKKSVRMPPRAELQ